MHIANYLDFPLQVAVKIEDEHYLRQHPEIREVLLSFLTKVLHEQPDDIEQYAAKHFTADFAAVTKETA